MSEPTPVTDYVRQCVKLLNEHNTGQRNVSTVEARKGYEALFELMDLDWDEGTEEDVDFREGYETCLLDMVGAIANEWHVQLPPMKVRHAAGK